MVGYLPFILVCLIVCIKACQCVISGWLIITLINKIMISFLSHVTFSCMG